MRLFAIPFPNKFLANFLLRIISGNKSDENSPSVDFSVIPFTPTLAAKLIIEFDSAPTGNIVNLVTYSGSVEL